MVNGGTAIRCKLNPTRTLPLLPTTESLQMISYPLIPSRYLTFQQPLMTAGGRKLKSGFDPRKESFVYFTLYWKLINVRGPIFSILDVIMKSVPTRYDYLACTSHLDDSDKNCPLFKLAKFRGEWRTSLGGRPVQVTLFETLLCWLTNLSRV